MNDFFTHLAQNTVASTTLSTIKPAQLKLGYAVGGYEKETGLSAIEPALESVEQATGFDIDEAKRANQFSGNSSQTLVSAEFTEVQNKNTSIRKTNSSSDITREENNQPITIKSSILPASEESRLTPTVTLTSFDKTDYSHKATNTINNTNNLVEEEVNQNLKPFAFNGQTIFKNEVNNQEAYVPGFTRSENKRVWHPSVDADALDKSYNNVAAIVAMDATHNYKNDAKPQARSDYKPIVTTMSEGFLTAGYKDKQNQEFSEIISETKIISPGKKNNINNEQLIPLKKQPLPIDNGRIPLPVVNSSKSNNVEIKVTIGRIEIKTNKPNKHPNNQLEAKAKNKSPNSFLSLREYINHKGD